MGDCQSATVEFLFATRGSASRLPACQGLAWHIESRHRYDNYVLRLSLKGRVLPTCHHHRVYSLLWSNTVADSDKTLALSVPFAHNYNAIRRFTRDSSHVCVCVCHFLIGPTIGPWRSSHSAASARRAKMNVLASLNPRPPRRVPDASSPLNPRLGDESTGRTQVNANISNCI